MPLYPKFPQPSDQAQASPAVLTSPEAHRKPKSASEAQLSTIEPRVKDPNGRHRIPMPKPSRIHPPEHQRPTESREVVRLSQPGKVFQGQNSPDGSPSSSAEALTVKQLQSNNAIYSTEGGVKPTKPCSSKRLSSPGTGAYSAGHLKPRNNSTGTMEGRKERR